MPKLARKSFILAKLETAYGTDPSPSPADAMQISNLSFNPVELQTSDRGLLKTHLGASPQLVVGSYVSIGFDVELAGSGTDIAPPAYAPLLKACGMAETIDTTDRFVEFKPVSGDFASVTIHFYADGTLQKITGARGTMTMSLSPGSVPVMSFSFTGQYRPASAAENPAPNLTKFQAPLPINHASTSFSIDGYQAVVHDLSFDLGNQVSHLDLIGASEVRIGDRQASGRLDIDMPPTDVKDFASVAQRADVVPVSLEIGSVAGSKVSVSAPMVQLADPSLGESEGTRTISLSLRLLPDAGDDELVIKTS